MSPDESALIRLWKEKRGKTEPGRAVTDVQRWVRHPVHRWMAATLDGFVNDLDAVFEAKFALPWSFSEEAAAETSAMAAPRGKEKPIRPARLLLATEQSAALRERLLASLGQLQSADEAADW